MSGESPISAKFPPLACCLLKNITHSLINVSTELEAFTWFPLKIIKGQYKRMPLILVLEYWSCVKLPDDFLLPGLKLCSLGMWLRYSAYFTCARPWFDPQKHPPTPPPTKCSLATGLIYNVDYSVGQKCHTF